MLEKMNSKLPKISVIVPAYNSENTISSCLNGLVNQTISADQYEIIVVDDASVDKTSAIIQSYLNIRYIKISHGGPSAARNEGAKAAIGDILVFTDADCVPTQDWLHCMTLPFDHPDIIGLKGAYQSQQIGFVPRFVQLEYESKYQRMRKFQFIDFIDTYSAAYRKKIFLENNGFDTNFTVASVEDQEFSFRLARKGYRMVFVPSAIVYHQHDRNSSRIFSSQVQYRLLESIHAPLATGESAERFSYTTLSAVADIAVGDSNIISLYYFFLAYDVMD